MVYAPALCPLASTLVGSQTRLLSTTSHTTYLYVHTRWFALVVVTTLPDTFGTLFNLRDECSAKNDVLTVSSC